MKKLILVKGRSNSGKSIAIINALMEYSEIACTRNSSKGKTKDFNAVCWNGKNVCFASAADQLQIIKANVDFFVNCGCDVAVSAINADIYHKQKGWWNKVLGNASISPSRVEISISKNPTDKDKEQRRVVKEILKEI